MSYKFLKSEIIVLILALLLSIPAVKEIWRPGYYPMHDDLQLMRLLQIDKCTKDRQFPCRWVPDMGYGYGYPLFNFYPPMPYYLGELFRLLGLSFISTAKVIFTLSFLTSAAGMYFLGQKFWGRIGGLLSSVFYVYAPYHATDLYVRGAVNESWAMAWYPFVLLGIKSTIDSPNPKNIALFSFSLAMLLLSHNPMTMIFFPLAAILTVYWISEKKNYKSILSLGLSSVWSLGLAAFFTIPVLLEQKYVHVETLIIGYFNYLAHFLDLNQLFIRMNWGFGESVYGPNDTMSFNIGHLHWIGWVVVTVLALLSIKRNPARSKLILLLSPVLLIYTFMTHSKSTEIWKLIKPLEFLQFPWRLLTIITFGTSFIIGSLPTFFSKKIFSVVSVSLIFAVIILNYKYFRWRDLWPWVDDSHKFSGELWRLQTTAGIFDYLPKWAPLPPAGAPNGDGEIISGNGTTQAITKKSNYQNHSIEVYSDQAKWRLNTFYFPGWKYVLDGKTVSVDPQKDLDPEVGRPEIFLSRGSHTFEAFFTETPVRSISNLISSISWIAFFVYLNHAYFFQNQNKKTSSKRLSKISGSRPNYGKHSPRKNKKL